jgi:GDPmannose 4,6-dehydratase
MHKMLQCDRPDDYAIGTGETHTVEEFLFEVFEYADLDISSHLRIDKEFMRPTDVHELRADIIKAKSVFDWNPKIRMRELAKIMLDADMRAQGLVPNGDGDALIHKYFTHKWWYGD